MTMDSCVVQRLRQHGIDIVFPSSATRRQQLHDIIISELSHNIFTEKSKLFYVETILLMKNEQHCDGIVLGCTEIPSLIKQSDVPQIPVLDTTTIHVQFAAEYQVGRVQVESILPPKGDK
ncbi:unnamed protein product [Didymodactylos carnosus]|uniref:Aspartate racemase n=1 Tax=Didymodactylos carnosus TaxID=1234261 RepID=A0A8S2FWY8_9BILA|nr:unnamed protein product [Didymodactylos carnosus]CAF4378978.1 unnamed protein product [Didymodactylos carnosus]